MFMYFTNIIMIFGLDTISVSCYEVVKSEILESLLVITDVQAFLQYMEIALTIKRATH